MTDTQAQQLKERSKRLVYELVAVQTQVCHELLRLIAIATEQGEQPKAAPSKSNVVLLKRH